MKKSLLLLLFLPLIVFAQNTTEVESQAVLNNNISFIEQFSYLAPMGINPYLTVFLTSLCSKLGFHNEYIATNPFFNNWFVVVLFGVLFLFTALVGTVFKTNKVTGSIALADTYLSNNAAIIINGIIILAPTFLGATPSSSEIVYEAGFISLSLKTMILLSISIYYLIIVTTVRFSIDIIIFLSPIPLVNSFLGVLKSIITLIFIIISIVSPITSFIISIVIFVIAIFFYRRSVKLVDKIKYLIVYPILNIFRERKQVLTNGNNLSILVLVNKKIGKLKKGKIVRLTQKNGAYLLTQKRYFLPKIVEEIAFKDCSFYQNHLNIVLKNESKTIDLILNRSYHKHIDELAKIFGIRIRKRAEIKLNLKFIDKLKKMFSKNDITTLKSI